MSEPLLADPIQPLDVAVVDQDLLWRVEVMNALRPLYADDFADVASVPERVHPADPTIVLLGRDLPATTPTQLVELRAARPHASVVAIASPTVPDAGLAGVDHVLAADIDDEDLVAELTRIVGEHRRAAAQEARRAEPDEEGAEDRDGTVADARLVVVTAAKGGAGTTTVALNLASTLAREGVGQHVALVETDPVYGDIGMMLGLPAPVVGSEDDLAIDDDLVRERCTFASGEDGLDVVLPPQPADPWLRLGGTDVDALVGAVALDHDWIVVDISPSSLVDSSLGELADLVLLVASTDVRDLKNARIAAAALRRRLGQHHELQLVLVDRDGRNRDVPTVESAAGVAVAGVVPHDRNVAASVARQRPVVELHPHAGAGRALRRLGEQTFRRLGVAARQQTEAIPASD